MSKKSSFIIVPVANEDVKANMAKTVNDRPVGYWCTPAGKNGNDTQVGDQIWFVGGKNEQSPTSNCVQLIGNITQIITAKESPEVFDTMSSVWSGIWVERNIVIFRTLPLLSKDNLTYDELCLLFDYKRLRNGSVRVVF